MNQDLTKAYKTMPLATLLSELAKHCDNSVAYNMAINNWHVSIDDYVLTRETLNGLVEKLNQPEHRR